MQTTQTQPAVQYEPLQLFQPWQVMRRQPALKAAVRGRLARAGRLPIAHRPLVFLDIETTGGTPSTSRITEIGALRVENSRVVRAYSQLINPCVPIPYFITRLTGIDDAMVRRAPSFAEIADDLEALLDGAIFVAHNVSFDYGFIKHEFAKLGRQFNIDRLCSVQLDRRLHPEQARHGLDCVIKRMGVRVASRHRAFDDAEVIYKFFQEEYAKNKIELFRCMQKLLVRTV